MDKEQEQESDMEELTLSEAAAEFRINRGTLNNWVYGSKPKLTGIPHYTELGQLYYTVRRGDITKLLQSKTNNGRPLKRS